AGYPPARSGTCEDGGVVRDVRSFVVLVPVKSPGTGKSRLASLPGEERAALAAAFADDVVAACLATPVVAEVVVISDDLDFAATLTGAVPCPDPGGGLNAALRHGAEVARHRHPHGRPVGLCADLPALRPSDLGAALRQVEAHSGPHF